MAKKIAPPKAPEKIAPTAVEISVARNGFLKPYAACFQYLPDNIAREPLGMLAGAMTINDRGEHSAYIVNFLASVAKKEYYGNPRRGAIESFEASLHKVNVGLAELAKEGNTEWIGAFDAAICIIERNNLHFSVSGNAKVLLFRDCHLSDISEGLADLNEDHPMKTFTDVASGKISPGDRLLITTPSLFSALSETELERSANRLSQDQFERLLQTAAINRLDLSASVLITIGTTAEYQQKSAPKKVLATVDSVPNAWSYAIFESSKQQENSVEAGLKEKKAEEDHVDNKTGHIYVTGETPNSETNEAWERTRILLEDFLTSFKDRSVSLGKNTSFFLANRKCDLYDLSKLLASKILDIFRLWREKRTQQESSARITSEETSPKNSLPSSEKEMIPVSSTDKRGSLFETFPEKSRQMFRSASRFLFPKQQTSHFSTEDRSKISRTLEVISEIRSTFVVRFAQAFAFLRRSLDTLSAQKKRPSIRIFIALCSISILGIFLRGFFVENGSSTTPTSPAETQSLPSETSETTLQDARTHALERVETVRAFQAIVNIVRLQETTFVITEDALYNIGPDGKNTAQSVYPDGMKAQSGISMPALNAILILTKSGIVLFFTPSNNRFAEERYTLPDSDNVIGIAASSTYLYALNRTSNMLFRYPRIKDGFGSATPWFKEPVSIESGTALAVSDSVFLADSSGIRSYFRGKAKAVQFETPVTPLSPTEILITASSAETSSELFVLDGNAGRILQYEANAGTIVAQDTSDSIKGATHFSVNPTTRSAVVSIGDTVLIAPLK